MFCTCLVKFILFHSVVYLLIRPYTANTPPSHDHENDLHFGNISDLVPLQNVLHELTEKCWDTCMDGVRPSTKLDSK